MPASWVYSNVNVSIMESCLAQGYVGLAPPMFRHEGPMTTELPEEMDTTIARFGRCTDIDILSYIRAAVDYIEA